MAEGVNVGNLWFGLDFKSSGDKDVNTKLEDLKKTLDQLVSGTHNIKLGFDTSGGSGGGGGNGKGKDPVETIREQMKNIDEMMTRMSKQREIFKGSIVDTSGLDEVIKKAQQVKKEMEAAASSPDAAKKYLQETSSKVNSQIAPYLQLQKAISEVDRQMSVLRTSLNKGVNTDEILVQYNRYERFKEALEEISAKANISSQSMQGVTQTMAEMATRTKEVTDNTTRQAKAMNALDTMIRNVSKKEIALQYKANTATDGSILNQAVQRLAALRTQLEAKKEQLYILDDSDVARLKKQVSDIMALMRTLEQESNALNKKLGGSQGGANGLSQSRELSNKITQMRLIAQLQRQIEKNNYRKTAYGLDPAKVEEQNRVIRNQIDLLNKLDTTKATRKDMAQQSLEVQKLIQGVNHALNLEKQRSSTNSQISREMQHQTRISQEMASALANYFSLSMVKQFLNDVIQIGGEFEIQHVALETILGDVAKANVLFGQLKEFAVKSPFQFRDIAQQTKQLAAFGIEEKNLFETTKRLADMAAGLGVDFGRLALALGETKSRTWLDAKELRQFAYAGVPLLQKLSEYYTEQKGKTVSTGDVRKMITKRLVSFEDTYEVIKKMTNQGGMFYDMQVKMSDTVAGKWSNLRDAYDVMLSEIEKGNNGILKNSIQLIMDLMKSWETWLPMVAGLSTGLLAFNGALLIASKGATVLAGAMTMLSANPVAAVIATVVGLGTVLYTAYRNAHALNNELSGMEGKSKSSYLETNSVLESLAVQLKRATDRVDESKKKLEELRKQNIRTKGSEEDYNKALQEKNDIIKVMNDKYGNFFSNQIQEADNWNTIRKKIDEANASMKRYFASQLYEQEISAINTSYQDKQQHLIELMDEATGNGAISLRIGELINQGFDSGKIYKMISEEFPNIDLANVKVRDFRGMFSNLSNPRGLWRTGTQLLAERTYYDEMAKKDAFEAEKRVKAIYGEFEKSINSITLGEGINDGPTEPEQQKGERDKELQQWQKRLQILKKLITEYKTLSDLYGETVAKARINGNQSYSGILSWFGIGDFTKEDDALKAALKRLEDMGLTTDERVNAKESLQLDIDNVGINIEKNAVEDAKKKLEREIKEITSKWKIFDDWFGATGNREFASRMAFGGNISFGNLAEEIEAKLNDALKADGSSLNAKELVGRLNKEGLESISRDFGKDSPIVKMVQQLSEEYMKLDETTASTLLDIVKSHRTAEQEIKAIDEKLAKDIKAVRENSSLDENTKNELVRGLREDAEKERSKKMFEQFQNTTGWAKAFEDLDRVSTETIDNMIERISRFITTTGLSITEIRSLQNAMKKLRSEKTERDPYAMIVDSVGRISSARRNLSMLRKAGVDRMTAADPYSTRYNPATGKIEQVTRTITKEDEQDDLQAGYADLDNSIAQVCKRFDALAQAADLVTNLLDAMGVDSSGAVGSVLSSATSGLQTGASIVNSLGLQNMGPWGAAAGAALSVTTALFQLHDKSIQKEIEASKARQEEMETLASNLEDALEKTMGSIYSFRSNSKFDDTLQKILDYGADNIKNAFGILGKLIPKELLIPYSDDTIKQARTAKESGTYYDAQLAALMAQYDEARFQYRKEQQKKKKDDNVLSDYQQSIYELENQLKNFVEEMANALYSIDFKSWADDLSSALVDAWAAGEDAAEAWKKTVSDILKDTAVSVISQKYIQEMLVPVMEEFMDDFEAKKGMIDEESMSIIGRMFGIADDAAKATSSFMDAMEDYAKQYGVTLKDTEKSASSGLSAGISSITEDTADLLASYVNAIRADVSAIRHINEVLLGDSDLGGMTAIQQSQLSQLILIETNTRRNTEYANQIYDLLRQATNGSKKIYVS